MATTTKFADLGTIVRVLSFDDNQVTETLKPAVYSVGFDMMTGFYLTKRSEYLTVPDRVYGSVQKKVDRILQSFEDSDKSFGVLLSGDKGSGKTMTSSLAANICIKEKYLPVIMIEEAFDGAGLVEFIEKIGECVLFIDEFGKKFDDSEGDQQALLGMFDGTSSARRLVILTENESRKINRYMLDRPGRIHYHFRHDKLDEQIVYEYCDDHEVPKTVADQICFRRETSIEFSFDVLQAIVKEYQMFGGDITDICQDLNIEQPLDYSSTDLEVMTVEDRTNNCMREYVSRGPVPFPSGRSNSNVILKGVSEPNCNDFAHISVKQIIQKEGDVYTFSTTDDMGNKLVITGRQKERDPLAF